MSKQSPKLSEPTTEKINGRYYTPKHIVNSMLDLVGYTGTSVAEKHVMENSCGNGAFLTEIVRRYCEAAQAIGKHRNAVALELEKYIHGIEIDTCECQHSIDNVSKVAKEFGIVDVSWDIQCADTLCITQYKGKMDFVIGNPPYVRVHNLKNYDIVKQYSFSQDGMTDLYIVFYEIGLSMLNKSGVLCYINPSSIFNSVAAKKMRKHLIFEKLLTAVVDFKHYQVFEATTYTAILVLSKNNKNDIIKYCRYNNVNNAVVYIDDVTYDDFYISGDYYFDNSKLCTTTKKIISHEPKKNIFDVKNGFATLCDSFFIGELSFEDYTIPIVKASTGENFKCLFPYDKHGNPIPYDALIQIPSIRQRYEQYEEKLKSRSLNNSDIWYVFGRSQGVKDVQKRKYAINSLIRDVYDIKLISCDAGIGVYSGFYILTKLTFEELKKLLFTDDFINYISMLGKYKSGGYYTYSSKDLLKYLDYKYHETEDFTNEQINLFEGT